jgi:hypothetical protein
MFLMIWYGYETGGEEVCGLSKGGLAFAASDADS